MRHPDDERLILHYYGEAEAGGVAEHLIGCGTCRQAYDRLARQLDAVSQAPVPELPGDYGARLWRRVEERLEPRRESRPAWSVRPGRLGWVAAVAALVLIAFLAGRHLQPDPPALPLSAEVRERILLAALGEHLDSTHRLLVDLTHVNADADIATEQARARRLASRSRLYRQAAVRQGEEQLADLLDRLELLLVDISNRPSRLESGDLMGLQRRIGRRGLLFKVRVLGEQARRDSSPTARKDRT